MGIFKSEVLSFMGRNPELTTLIYPLIDFSLTRMMMGAGSMSSSTAASCDLVSDKHLENQNKINTQTKQNMLLDMF